ncbi:MAG TPA: hypothetical protein VGC82_21045 [Rhodopila sp.]
MLLRFHRGNDAGGFGVKRALTVGVLLVEAAKLRVIGAEPAAQPLNLSGQLLDLRAQLDHGGGNRGLRFGAGLAASGIEPRIRRRMLRLP